MAKHHKMTMIGGGILSIFISAFISALMITYLYPFIYNSINKYTERGSDIEVDYWNAYIMVVMVGLIILPLTLMLFNRAERVV